jgi:energy-coupling factor transporter ATP-binding protein EcfA2
LLAKATLKKLEQVAPADTVASILKEFNDQYFVVNDSGKVLVFQPTHDEVRKRKYYQRIAFADFHRLYMNRLVEIGAKKVTKKAAKDETATETEEKRYDTASNVWLRSRTRKQFLKGVKFDPTGKEEEGWYNLWQGFAYDRERKGKPKGSWQRLKKHIWRVICRRNEEHFNYVMNWMASLLQFPERQGEAVVVMIGKQGSGKGTLARALKRLLGQHGMAVSNPGHLVGKFNLHLRDCVFVFGDECFYAGDKKSIGVLKAMITEDSLVIEGKGKDIVESPNYLHIMLASNYDWAVPAELDDRRFFVLSVSDEMIGDHAYFTAIWQEMENGGYEAMLDELLSMDLSGFRPGKIPKTEALQEQKQETLDLNYRWWQDILYRGYVYESKLALEDVFQQWYPQISTELLYKSYDAFVQKQRPFHRLHRNTLGGFMKKLGGRSERSRKMVGEHVFTDYETRKVKALWQNAAMGYEFGDLNEARRRYLEKTGLHVVWPEDEPTEEDRPEHARTNGTGGGDDRPDKTATDRRSRHDKGVVYH